MRDLENVAQRVRAGDVGAFRALVEATSNRLVRLAARILGNLSDAEDAVQDAYVKAFQSLTAGSFEARARVETWLYRIVVNQCLDALRQRRRRASEGEQAVEPTWDGAASAEAHLALRELRDLCSDLPEEQRAALVLKAVEGFTSRETAEILEISEGAVEQRLVRARAALRERIVK